MALPPNVLYVDFETYYSTEYSLSRMTEKQYVCDPRFTVHGTGVALDDGPVLWLDREQSDYFFAHGDFSQVAIAGHKLTFDGMVLTQHYSVNPRLWIDTLGMARAIVGTRLRSLGLDSLGKAFGLGGKRDEGKALLSTRGLQVLTPEQLATLGEYCKDDVRLTRELARMFGRLFPSGEYQVLDWTIRMAVNPQVLVDTAPLDQLAAEETKAKHDALEKVGLPKTKLASNAQFAQLLRDCGIEPPTKTSKTTGKQTYAFAKNDEEFVDLLDHPNDYVHDLVAARLVVKSTIKESRAAKLKELSTFGALPIVLKYAGAQQTHRLCLVGDTRIVVKRGGRVLEIQLAQLQEQDMLWDGIEFVTHDGLAYAGEKEVITYDDITGTPDHRVFVAPPGEQPRFVGLAEAAARGYDICAAAAPVGFGFCAGVLWPRDEADARNSDLREMRGAQDNTLSGHREGGARLVQVLCGQSAYGGEGRKLGHDGSCGESERGKPAGFAGRCDATRMEAPYGVGEGREAALHEPEQRRIQELWRPRDTVQLHVSDGGSAVGVCELGATSYTGAQHRPDGQRRELRSGKPSLGNTHGAGAEQIMAEARMAQTFDVVNCGPRNQFAANGRIVHNSGGGGINVQNFTRKSLLRKALRAPKGKRFVAADLSQIELRGNCAVSGQLDVLHALARGDDVYLNFAKQIYDDPTLTKEFNGDERTTGKIAELSLGYYSGAATFKAMLRAQAHIRIMMDEATRIVRLYRRTHPMIAGAWQVYGQWIKAMAHGEVPYMDAPINAPVELTNYGFILPSGLEVTYPGLTRYDFKNQTPVGLNYVGTRDDQIGWAYVNAQRPGGYAKLHAGVFNNNLIQSLCRDVNIVATKEILRALPDIDPNGQIVMSVHDETVALVDEDKADETLAMMLGFLKTPPEWWPELPVTAEGAHGETYYDCK